MKTYINVNSTVKIVEGHEQNVIDGGLQTIKKNMPVMLIEIEERHSKKPITQTINNIKELGYDAYFFYKDDLVNINQNNNFKLERNFIFVKKS